MIARKRYLAMVVAEMEMQPRAVGASPVEEALACFLPGVPLEGIPTLSRRRVLRSNADEFG
jgi:hypothetical protein